MPKKKENIEEIKTQFEKNTGIKMESCMIDQFEFSKLEGSLKSIMGTRKASETFQILDNTIESLKNYFKINNILKKDIKRLERLKKRYGLEFTEKERFDKQNNQELITRLLNQLEETYTKIEQLTVENNSMARNIELLSLITVVLAKRIGGISTDEYFEGKYKNLTWRNADTILYEDILNPEIFEQLQNQIEYLENSLDQQETNEET